MTDTIFTEEDFYGIGNEVEIDHLSNSKKYAKFSH